MVKIRLRRTGAKKKPNYRVVVTESSTPRDGRFIEIVGHYNPRTEPSTLEIHEDRVLYWLSVGAQPTDPVKKLLKNLGTLDRFARLKAGEDLEKLLLEAETAREKNAAAVQTKVEKTAKKSKAKEDVTAQAEAEAVEVEASVEEETAIEAVEEEEALVEEETATEAAAEIEEEAKADSEETSEEEA